MISLCGDTESNVSVWHEGVFQANVAFANHFMRQVEPVFCIGISLKITK